MKYCDWLAAINRCVQLSVFRTEATIQQYTHSLTKPHQNDESENLQTEREINAQQLNSTMNN